MKQEDRLTNDAGLYKGEFQGDELLKRKELQERVCHYESTGLSPEEIEAMKDENAALTKRLKNAGLPPCEFGDTIYVIHNGEVVKGTISMLMFLSTKKWKIRISYTTNRGYKTVFDRFYEDINKNVIFTTQKAAEARLKEL